MQIVIPLEGRVRTVIRSSFVAAKRLAESQYTLSGDNFQMTGVTAEQVLILPDTVGVSEGQTVTDEMKMQALPFEGFIAVSAEETLPAVLGLLLRSAVADGKLTDEELLSVQPALEGRVWQTGISVQVGDVYACDGFLWRCIQAHTTQTGWEPDKAASLWAAAADPAETWPAWSQPTGAHDAYSAGDRVSHNGKHWTSDADGNVWEPGVHGWTESADG